jgi:hypothetical protein
VSVLWEPSIRIRYVLGVKKTSYRMEQIVGKAVWKNRGIDLKSIQDGICTCRGDGCLCLKEMDVLV